MGKEENSFHGNVCAYLTCRLMGDTEALTQAARKDAVIKATETPDTKLRLLFDSMTVTLHSVSQKHNISLPPGITI